MQTLFCHALESWTRFAHHLLQISLPRQLRVGLPSMQCRAAVAANCRSASARSINLIRSCYRAHPSCSLCDSRMLQCTELSRRLQHNLSGRVFVSRRQSGPADLLLTHVAACLVMSYGPSQKQ